MRGRATARPPTTAVETEGRDGSGDDDDAGRAGRAGAARPRPGESEFDEGAGPPSLKRAREDTSEL